MTNSLHRTTIVRKSNFPTMHAILIRVRTKYQITIPVAIRKAMKLRVGDWLEVTFEKGMIVFKPKRMVDRKKN